MPNTETIVDTKQRYRDHYIRIIVTARPPLPHDDGESGTITARVRVYDGPPGDMGLLSPSEFLAGDVVDSWEEEIPLFDSENAVGELIEQAKGRVDRRSRQRYGVRESVTIAIERELTTDTGGDDE